jgi:quercetin dioxygenase-like cupin family protein
MELSERFIRELEREYATVYEHQDPAGKIYEEHAHPYETAVYVTDGDMTVTIEGVEHHVEQNKRFDVPTNTPHIIKIGPAGAIYIIGEEKL